MHAFVSTLSLTECSITSFTAAYVQETQPPSDFGKTSVEIGVMKDLLENNRLLFEVGSVNCSLCYVLLLCINKYGSNHCS